MLEMDTPWWELIVRAAAVYAALLVLVRVSGKRTVGQFTPFDLLVMLLLSEAVSNALSGGDESVLGGLISASTLLALNFSVGWCTARSRRLEAAIEGQAVLLGRDGRVYPDVLRRERVGQADFDKALREADCHLQEMRCAFLEADGSISILKR
ncbi:MAG TPA: YetF domain-containing protein [Ramlibacter sp.]|uniref:DUF421 domain-containing protein n=1 Tax=Ramlibacter sp. TaxID=1917967 RepID=UPI002D2C2B29|nr:YetF domain-containing protein [Ramlibacter sp.]HZY17185.1 YetF domain-containing protein [Ramlibacter sp.]